MNTIKQISHTEYDSPIGHSTALSATDRSIDIHFRGVPAYDQLSPSQRLTVGRQVLVSQEVAAHHRHGFYYKYIGALAGVGLRNSFIHHEGDNGIHHPENIPGEAMTIFARAVYLRGNELNNHPLYHDTQGISAEAGYVTQYADWTFDEDLTEAINELPSNPKLAELGVTFDTIHDKLAAPDIRYKAKISDNPDEQSDFPAITLTRIRPVADLGLRCADGIQQTLQVVKRSTFAFTPDSTDKEGLHRTEAFLEARRHKGVEANALGQSVVERAIAEYRGGIVPRDTFPAESLYFAILRKRSVK